MGLAGDYWSKPGRWAQGPYNPAEGDAAGYCGPKDFKIKEVVQSPPFLVRKKSAIRFTHRSYFGLMGGNIQIS
jgi:hypothetical protein